MLLEIFSESFMKVDRCLKKEKINLHEEYTVRHVSLLRISVELNSNIKKYGCCSRDLNFK